LGLDLAFGFRPLRLINFGGFRIPILSLRREGMGKKKERWFS
jgi:hypothetical protein